MGRQRDGALLRSPLQPLREAAVGFLCLFFFFQAEDGIRDVAVTGVQTCALPISFHTVTSYTRDSVRRRAASLCAGHAQQLGGESPLADLMEVRPSDDARATAARRSEERRVGKECRSRWSPYH